ncbi:MAG: hypothetical protein LBK95_10495 [Bifidobacteriaceae bacterium]|nr:hypothetical protein [Bifidobacteriaceae bacterium]
MTALRRMTEAFPSTYCYFQGPGLWAWPPLAALRNTPHCSAPGALVHGGLVHAPQT